MYNSYGSSPSYRAGLGTPGAAQNITPANLGQQEKFSLFVGNIPSSLDDIWLERIFSAAGSLIQLRRIRDPAGVPKPFGFAEYGDAESVLRCLELLNGIPLAGLSGPEQILKVTADEKTRARLNDFEKSRGSAGDAQMEAMEYAQNTLRTVLDELKDADPSQSQAALEAAERARKIALIPQHLQDLGPNDLPEESRGVITKEIAFFREQAAKKEAAKKAQQQDKDRDRSAGLAQAHFGTSATTITPRDDRRNNNNGPFGQNQSRPNQPPQDYSQQRDQGYQRRNNYNDNNSRGGGGAFGPDAQNFRGRGGFNSGGGRGQQRQWGGQQQHNRPHVDDPQGYNRPVGFVRGGNDSRRQEEDHYRPASRYGDDREDARMDEDMTDEDRERMRQDRIRREADFIFRERERKWETKERSRQAAADKDRMRENGVQKNEDADRVKMAQKLAEWDDVKESERGRELFHVDRTRWRAQRKAFRQREIIEDRKDAELETQQLEAINKQTQSFLESIDSVSAKDAASTSKKSKPTADDSTPFKLSLAERAEKKQEMKPVEVAPLRPRPAAFGAGEEQEEEGVKKKRELIPLVYSDDEGGEEDPNERGLTQDEKIEVRKRKIKELVESIPITKEGLWAHEIRWNYLTDKMLTEKIEPFAVKKVVEALGTEDEDLVSAVMDKLREHGSAQDMVEELEPILEDEAVEFVIKIWRFLLFELLAKIHRIKTTTV